MNSDAKAVVRYEPLVLLLHGTWGRRSKWTKPGGIIREAIVAECPNVSVERFEWRGRNRFQDRFQGAHILSEKLATEHRPVLVVAHSHGGNVAAMALGSNRAASDRFSRQLITVGTPFVRFRYFAPSEYAFVRSLRRGDGKHWQRKSLLTLDRISGLLLTFLVAWLWVSGLEDFGLEVSSANIDNAVLSPLSGASAALSRFNSLIIAWAVRATVLSVCIAMGLRAWGAARLGASRLDLMEWLGFGEGGGYRTIAITTSRDEAALSLRFAQLVGRTASTLSRWIDRLLLDGVAAMVTGASLLGFIVAVLASPDEQYSLFDVDEVAVVFVWSSFAPYGDEIIALVGGLLVFWAAAGLVVVCLIVAEYCVAGLDGLALGTRGRVEVTSSGPPSTESLVVNLGTYSRRVTSLRHSRLLLDESVVREVVRVCGEFARGE